MTPDRLRELIAATGLERGPLARLLGYANSGSLRQCELGKARLPDDKAEWLEAYAMLRERHNAEEEDWLLEHPVPQTSEPGWPAAQPLTVPELAFLMLRGDDILSKREAHILMQRRGWNAERRDPVTLKELADLEGVAIQTINAIERRAYEKLRYAIAEADNPRPVPHAEKADVTMLQKQAEDEIAELAMLKKQ